MTIRPAYDQPRPLAYINKVIQRYHGLAHIRLDRWREGYHNLTYDDGVVFEQRSIMVPHTNDQPLGRWVQDAIQFNADVLEMYS